MIRRYGNQPVEIVVIHGGPGACGSLACVAKELGRTHGAAEPIQSRHTVAGLIEELHEQVKLTTSRPVTLLGHSWGAWLAVLYAARHPELVRQIILVGSGPFKKQYVPRILERRLSRLSPGEAESFRLILSQLSDRTGDDQGQSLSRLGALAEKADNFHLLENDADQSGLIAIDGPMYASVWPQAEEMRRNGELTSALKWLKCAVMVIHGEYDPHPVEGVVKPLEEQGVDVKVHVLPKCGHSPFKEKFAAGPFFKIIRETI